MAPVDFSAMMPAGFVFMHPGALETDTCKDMEPISAAPRPPVPAISSYPAEPQWQWVLAEPAFQQPAVVWQPAVWQFSEPAAQAANFYYSDSSIPCDNAWAVPPACSADASGEFYWQPHVQTPSVQSLLPTADALRGQVWKLAREEAGCRLIQQALEEATTDEQRNTLAAELQTHVVAALRSPNANHVIQKCISTMRPMQSQFIIDEISGSACTVARHRYGCRVLQRLFEHCPSAQLRGLLDELLEEAVALSTHVYGSYVMKHFLEHGNEKDANALTWILAENVIIMREHDYGFPVLGEALRQAGQAAKMALASALLLHPDMLTNMAHSRHGNLTVKLLLQVSEGTLPTERQTAVSELMARKVVLEGSRYGRVVSKYLTQCSEEA